MSLGLQLQAKASLHYHHGTIHVAPYASEQVATGVVSTVVRPPSWLGLSFDTAAPTLVSLLVVDPSTFPYSTYTILRPALYSPEADTPCQVSKYGKLLSIQ